jgi:hypothetical protein
MIGWYGDGVEDLAWRMGKQWPGGWIVGVCYDTHAKENAKSFLE